MLKGLREPQLKRTVEGDLGMRVNAPAVLETARGVPGARTGRATCRCERLRAFVGRVSRDPRTICRSDDVGAPVRRDAGRRLRVPRPAAARGRVEESYGVDGKIYVQRGKDLRRVATLDRQRRLPGQPAARPRSTERVLDAARRDAGGTSLLPQPAVLSTPMPATCLPLLGNLARDFPAQAVTAGHSRAATRAHDRRL